MNIQFDAFNSTSSVKNANVSDLAYSLNEDATATLDRRISDKLIQDVFYFRTDSDITQNSTEVYYYVDMTNWTQIIEKMMNPFNSTVTSGYFGANSSDSLGKDFLRHIANQVFGSHFAVDLFTNEDSVYADIDSKCAPVSPAILTILNSVNIDSPTLSNVDPSNNNYKYLIHKSSLNLCRELVDQLQAAGPSRLSALNEYEYRNMEGYYSIPLVEDDTISFKMTLTAADGQHNVTQKTNAISSRTYQISLKVGKVTDEMIFHLLGNSPLEYTDYTNYGTVANQVTGGNIINVNHTSRWDGVEVDPEFVTYEGKNCLFMKQYSFMSFDFGFNVSNMSLTSMLYITDGLTSSSSRIFSFDTLTVTYMQTIFYIDNGNFATSSDGFFMVESQYGGTMYTLGTANRNKWIHISMIFDNLNGGYKLYADNIELVYFPTNYMDAAPTGTETFSFTNEFFVGHSDDDGPRHEAYNDSQFNKYHMYNVRVFDRALIPTERAFLYDLEIT